MTVSFIARHRRMMSISLWVRKREGGREVCGAAGYHGSVEDRHSSLSPRATKKRTGKSAYPPQSLSLLIVVDLDELVNVVARADGVGELVDERAAVAAVQASGAGRGGAGGDMRPTAQRIDCAAGSALEVEAGVRVHRHGRPLDR